jgi:hypothetical protein
MSNHSERVPSQAQTQSTATPTMRPGQRARERSATARASTCACGYRGPGPCPHCGRTSRDGRGFGDVPNRDPRERAASGGTTKSRRALEREAERFADSASQADRPVSPVSLRAARGSLAEQNPLVRAVVQAGVSSSPEPLSADHRQMLSGHGNAANTVRVHRDATANAASRVLGAHGFAHGDHIVLSAGARDATSAQGRHTLAHEVAHVGQQTGFTRSGRSPFPQFSRQTYLDAMNRKPEPDWATAAEHLNGESPKFIKEMVKNLQPAFRVKLHEAARKWPGSCSNVARFTEEDYLKKHPEVKPAAEACSEKSAPPADQAATLRGDAAESAAPKASAPAQGASAAGPTRTRAGAAVELLRRTWASYKSTPADKDRQYKYVKGVRDFVDEKVTDHKMFKAFGSLEADSKRNAIARCNEALSQVKRLEGAYRHGYPPLDDERTWKSAIGAMSMAQQYLDMIVNYRDPVKLRSGWHLITDGQGTVLGYLYLFGGYHEIRDANGAFVESGEIPLEAPLIDPIDIVSGGIAGVIRGPLRSGIATLVRRAAPRVRGAAAGVAIGIADAAPVVAGRVAPTAVISAEVLAESAVPTLARGAQSTIPRAVAAQGAKAEASTLATAPARAATTAPAATPATASGGSASQAAVGTGGSAAANQIPGATTVNVSPTEYAQRLSFVTPAQFDDAVLNAVEQAGQRAATTLSNPANARGARFIQACQARNWTLAGTLFHAEAAIQIRAMAATLAGRNITIRAEDVVQSGAGGSRLDVTAVDGAGNHYAIDWKTTGKSALSTGSRREMDRHAAQYAANRPAPLNVQISKSWVDFVRAQIPNVNWPK